MRFFEEKCAEIEQNIPTLYVLAIKNCHFAGSPSASLLQPGRADLRLEEQTAKPLRKIMFAAGGVLKWGERNSVLLLADATTLSWTRNFYLWKRILDGPLCWEPVHALRPDESNLNLHTYLRGFLQCA